MVKGPVYFLSDIHLGSFFDKNGDREKALLDFLRALPADTAEIYLLGDVFDFWVEYKDVIPKGYTRIFGELASLSDSGVKIYFFRGNHDYWVDDYFQKELGIEVIDDTYIIKEICGKTFCLGHGDGLGPQKFSNRFIFKLFRNKACIRLLKILHPHSIFDFAWCWSRNSRRKHLSHPYLFRDKEDPLYFFANELSGRQKIDYFIFGHLHNSVRTGIENGGEMFILNDWEAGANYIRLDGEGITLIA